MAPMVMLGSRDATPRRYWGEGQGPTASPSQASLLLARINSRARERKAGMGQRRLSVGLGEEQELGEGLSTPKHTNMVVQSVTPREQIEATPKDHPVDAATPVTKAELRVNGVRTEETSPDIEAMKKKKRKKKDSEGEESKGVLETSEIPESVGEDGTPIIKKKKKRKKDREELQMDDEESQSAIPETEMAEAELVKKKKKKRHKEIENGEESISAETEKRSAIQIKTESKHKEHVEINGEKAEGSSDFCEDQRKKKKRNRRDEASEEMESTQTLTTLQQEEDINSSSPRKKKKKKDKKQELEEEKTSEKLKSTEVPKIEIKQEIVDTLEEIQTEGKMKESHIDRDTGVNEKVEGKDNQKAVVGKRKKWKKEKKMKDKLNTTEVEGFTLLTEVEETKKKKVQRTLPHWLAKPTLISRDLVAGSTPLDSFCGLDACLVEELKFQKVQQLFPVQKVVIPEILASAGPLSCRYRPRDLCVAAPTGSGKTLAYVLPLVQTLKSRTVPRIRVLVLLPVQELVNQVYNVFCTYCKGTPLHVGKAVGLTAMSKEQANLVENHLGCYHSLVDILVATPGRLADHLRMTQGLDLSALRYLVLDEADRMLAAEGGDWMHHIERAIVDHRARQENQLLLQPPLQRLLFSATLSSDPEHLQHVALHHPKLYTVAASAAGEADRDKSTAVVTGQFVRPAELREEFVVVEEEVKPLALHHLLVSGKGRHRVLVFTNSIKATHNLALLLAALSEGSGRVVAEFSSKSRKRHQVLSQFREGKIHVLVSSDAMARGVDIPDIDHVVCYDVTVASTYVHRIGRTARAGRPGTALSLVTKPMLREFRRALSDEGKGASQLTLSHEELEPYEQQYIDALATLKKMLEEEEREKHQKQIHIGKRKQLNRRQRVRKQKKQKLADKRRGMRKFTVNANNLRHHNEY
ncbi:ATP-dependent RNA helicase DDX51-like [Portunus trituberculatus]|uniref:ATP-dependent RNA helicase DDX51-like n=1 Tax=Portunus trituberculatus TaxID=210409 RepID=UPI001E1D0034|nr:ATP-dependent RNA helicase DDX51-like [Portunus trituberculatus]